MLSREDYLRPVAEATLSQLQTETSLCGLDGRTICGPNVRPSARAENYVT